MVINNLCAVQSQKYMKTNEKKKKESVEKLSSGYKINKAADDAAGLSISEDMRKQVRGLNRASINSQEGISAVQIADGAMAEVQEMLNRGLELCIESANGTHSESDRESLQQEIEQIKTEIDAIADRTYYSELQVLKSSKGEDAAPTFHKGEGLVYRGGLPSWVGINADTKDKKFMTETYQTVKNYTYKDANGNEQLGTATINHAAAKLNFGAYNGSVAQRSELYGNGFYFTCCTCSNHYSVKFRSGTDSWMEKSEEHYIYNIGIDDATNGNELVKKIIEALDNGNPAGHYTNLVQNGSELIVYDDRSMDSIWELKNNGIVDPGITSWDADWKNPINTTRGTGTIASKNYGKFGEGVALVDKDYINMPGAGGGESVAIQAGSETGEMIPLKLPKLSSKTIGVAEVNIKTVEGALIGIDLFKNASTYVSAERSRCGAYQNRMEHNIMNVENTEENVTASESRLRDTEMVKEQMDFTKSNILAQAGQAILAQANQSYRGVINLLAF